MRLVGSRGAVIRQGGAQRLGKPEPLKADFRRQEIKAPDPSLTTLTGFL